MDLAKLSEAVFLCDGARTDNVDNPMAFELGASLVVESGYHFLRSLRDGYELHQVNGQHDDIVLVCNGEVVGSYLGESLAVHPAHQRRGLSTPMILAAAPLRPPPCKRIVSVAGEAALRKAWRVANRLAHNLWP